MRTRNSFINVRDLVIFSSIAIVVSILTCIALADKANWTHATGLWILLGTTAGFWLVFLGVLMKNLVGRPDFILDPSGIAVWTLKGAPSQEEMKKAIDYFRAYTAHALVTMRICSDHLEANKRVDAAIKDVCVEWRKDLINESWASNLLVNKAGIQKDKLIVVQLKDPLSKTALFHELLHVIDQYVRGNYDPEHKDTKWWSLDDELCVGYGK